MSQSLKFNSIHEVFAWLDSIPTFQHAGMKAANMNLEQITEFCKAMGNPHREIRTIHVAGTNGKGSVCAILASVYAAAGYKTGLFTSPHLVRMNERFRIGGKEISEEELLEFFQQHVSLLEKIPLTYFEITTAIAFWWFYRQKVDLAIIETGLGGRLDATNIIRPMVSVITTISRDHTNYLGTSLSHIAREKAGIIKPGIPLVTGNIPETVKPVIAEAVERSGSEKVESHSVRPHYDEKHKTYNLFIAEKLYRFKSDLISPVHCHNAAMAWLTVAALNNKLPVTVRKFQKGLLGTRRYLPGRFEKLLDDRQWYFDGAHNLQAVQALKETIRSIHRVEETVVIFALMEDKLDKILLDEFSDFKKNFYYTMNSDRAASYDEIRQILEKIQPLPGNEGELLTTLNSLKSEVVIFTGSFYFFSTVKKWLDQILETR